MGPHNLDDEVDTAHGVLLDPFAYGRAHAEVGKLAWPPRKSMLRRTAESWWARPGPRSVARGPSPGDFRACLRRSFGTKRAVGCSCAESPRLSAAPEPAPNPGAARLDRPAVGGDPTTRGGANTGSAVTMNTLVVAMIGVWSCGLPSSPRPPSKVNAPFLQMIGAQDGSHSVDTGSALVGLDDADLITHVGVDVPAAIAPGLRRQLPDAARRGELKGHRVGELGRAGPAREHDAVPGWISGVMATQELRHPRVTDTENAGRVTQADTQGAHKLGSGALLGPLVGPARLERQAGQDQLHSVGGHVVLMTEAEILGCRAIAEASGDGDPNVAFRLVQGDAEGDDVGRVK